MPVARDMDLQTQCCALVSQKSMYSARGSQLDLGLGVTFVLTQQTGHVLGLAHASFAWTGAP